MSRPDALHEPRGAKGLLVDQVAKLWNIDTGRPSWGRRKRKPLPHPCKSEELCSSVSPTTCHGSREGRRASWERWLSFGCAGLGGLVGTLSSLTDFVKVVAFPVWQGRAEAKAKGGFVPVDEGKMIDGRVGCHLVVGCLGMPDDATNQSARR